MRGCDDLERTYQPSLPGAYSDRPRVAGQRGRATPIGHPAHLHVAFLKRDHEADYKNAQSTAVRSKLADVEPEIFRRGRYGFLRRAAVFGAVSSLIYNVRSRTLDVAVRHYLGILPFSFLVGFGSQEPTPFAHPLGTTVCFLGVDGFAGLPETSAR